MTDLLADLQAAPEGSRDLSDRVLLACGYEDRRGDGFLWPPGVPKNGNLFYDGNNWPPDPTRSVDDALALVPEGLLERITHWKDPQEEGWGAELYSAKGQVTAEEGPTPALALCIAILKAREQDNG